MFQALFKVLGISISNGKKIKGFQQICAGRGCNKRIISQLYRMFGGGKCSAKQKGKQVRGGWGCHEEEC